MKLQPFVIHGSRTRLARELRKKHRFRRRDFKTSPDTFDWNLDTFLAYPDPSKVKNAPAKYAEMRAFFSANKKEQWEVLKKYFMTPEIDKPPYVVRPLRHEGGIGFEIVNELPNESRAATHYWRSLWKRECEYRVIFVKGKKTITLLKRVPAGTAQDIAWNAGVSSFVTVHDHENDRLRHTKFYEKAEAFFKDYPFHLVAIDVLYRDCKHRVVEVNFCPGVLIPENLELLLNQFKHDASSLTPAGRDL